LSAIPLDWERTTIGASAKFLTGFPFSSSRFTSNGIRLIRGSNVKRAELDWSPDITRYWPKEEGALRQYLMAEEDLVIAMDGALVGLSYAQVSNEDLPAYLVQRVARLRGKSVDQGLLYAWLGSQRFVDYADSVRTNTAIPHISPRDIRDFEIEVPKSRGEQRRISQALRDAGDLIVSLERLIVKKSDIKQGMMQQLLTGRTRLPGFEAPWSRRRLADLLRYEQPGRFLVRTTQHLETGRVPVLTAGKTFLLGYTNDTEGIYTAHPVIIFDDFTTASKYVDFEFKAKSSAMKILSVNTAANLRFVYERMQLIDFPVGDHKRHWISEYSKQELLVPSEDEQTAIAEILAVADLERATLRERLEKARFFKQGMMQELLTGRIRLPAAEVMS
jgi:type I restriction enzyme S subunit